MRIAVPNTLAAVLSGALLGVVPSPAPSPAPAAPQPSNTTPPRARGGFVTPVYDSVPPQIPADIKGPNTILIFSKTNGYREEPAIQASNDALAAIAKKRGWPAFVTENAAVMNADLLSRFTLAIWNNTSGDVLTEAQ